MRTNKPRTIISSPDFTLFISIIMLVIFGSIMVFSSSFSEGISKYGNPYHFIKRHLIFVGLGFLCMLFFMNLNYRILKKYSLVGFIAGVLLGLSLFVIGVDRNGAVRWINIQGFVFMPADIIKITTIVFFAAYLEKASKSIGEIRKSLPIVVLIIGASVVGFAKEDYGTTLILISTILTMYFVGGMNLVLIPIFAGGGLVAGGYLIGNMSQFRKNRLIAFTNPFEYKQDIGWQVVQSLYAIGSGGITGVGLGQSKQKYLYLSEAHNDFIFAIVAEELGLIGSILVLLIFGIIIWRGILTAINAKDLFGRYLATGIIALFAIQSLIHIGVVTSSIPTTGVTLPLISYGGTSLIMNMLSFGILLNISRYSKERNRG